MFKLEQQPFGMFRVEFKKNVTIENIPAHRKTLLEPADFCGPAGTVDEITSHRPPGNLPFQSFQQTRGYLGKLLPELFANYFHPSLKDIEQLKLRRIHTLAIRAPGGIP